MGILDYFFKKKEKKTIKLRDLNSWILEQTQKLTDETTLINNEIRSKKAKIEEYLDELEEKSLVTPEVVPDRAKTIFYDNKKQYIQKTTIFLEKLEPPKEVLDMPKYLKKIIEELEILSEDTKRNFFIVREFLQTDMTKIAKKLQELEKKAIEGINYYEKENMNLVEEIIELEKEYEKELGEIKRLREEIEKIENYKLDLYSKKDVYLDKIKNLKKSPLYEELKEVRKELEEVEKRFLTEEKALKNLISELDLVIKKYSRKNKTKLTFYQKDLMDGLKKVDLEKELEPIEKKLDELDLKKTKQDKVKKAIKKLKEYNKKELLELQEKRDTLKRRERNNSANLNIKEIEGRTDQLDQSIKIENKKIGDIHLKLERINPKLTKQKIRDMIKKVDEYTELEI
ncbi:MAG: hypothetical protein ACMXX9_00850 [Candidatus Woesearchaeota archaeon]